MPPETTIPETSFSGGGAPSPGDDSPGGGSPPGGPPEGGGPFADLLEKIRPNALKPLSEKSLPNPPKKRLAEGEVEEALPFDVDNVTFSVFGKAGIFVFNAASDKDPDGLLGTPAAKKDDLKIGRLIDFDPAKVWLKYDLEAGVRPHIELKDDGFDFNAEAGVRHVAYRIHDPEELVGEAVLRDVTSPRFLFSEDDLRKLKPGEAVALFAHGKLQAQLEYKWSDLLTNGISVLGRLLPVPGEVFNIQVGAAVTAKLDVSVRDVFQVVVTRVDDDRFRVAAHKADGKSLAAGFNASITAKLANEQDVEKVLGQAVDGLLGAPLKSVRDLLGRVTGPLDGLGDTERALVDKVLERLGLDGLVDDVESLKKKVDAFEKDVEAKLKEIAETKAELSFSYDYKRVRSEDAVLVASLEASALSTYHKDLVRGRIQQLLTDADDAGKPALTLERFLYQKSLKVEKSWGFSLGFGKWFKASGKDTVEIEDVTRTNEKGDVLRTFLGSRGYQGKWHRDELNWDVDFNAEMPEFSPRPDTANEFDYSLDLQVENKQGKVKDGEIASLVDRAVIWGCAPWEQADEEIVRVGALLDGRKDVTFSYRLKLDATAFSTLLDELATRDAAGFGEALGEAMLWRKDLRRNPQNRRKLYGGLWQKYLVDEAMTPRGLAAAAAEAFDRHGHGTLAFQERNWRTLPPTTTIGGLAALNGEVRDNWLDFVAGAAVLKKAIAKQKSHEEIRKAYKKMRRLWRQSHHVWALGVYLRDLLARHPELGENAERIFTLSFKGDDGKKIVEHVGTSRPKPAKPS